MPRKKHSKGKSQKGSKQITFSSPDSEMESNTVQDNIDIGTDLDNSMPRLEVSSDVPTPIVVPNTQNESVNVQMTESERFDNPAAIIDNLWDTVPTFAGTSSESDIPVAEFLENFEEISRLVKCSENTKLFLLRRKLLGEAKGVIFNNPHLKNSKSYKEIVQALKDHFLSSESRAKKMKEFLDIHQMPEESVKTFACRLKAASYFAFPDCINSEKEEEFRCESLCEVFQSNLNKEIQKLMVGRVITSFESALKVAQFDEKYIALKHKNKTQQLVNVIHSENSPQNLNDTEMEAFISHKLDELERQVDRVTSKNVSNGDPPLDINDPVIQTILWNKLEELEKQVDNAVSKNVTDKNLSLNLNDPEEVERFMSDKLQSLERQLDNISENHYSGEKYCNMSEDYQNQQCYPEQNAGIFCEICQSEYHWTNQCEQWEEPPCNFCGAFDHTEEFCNVGEEEYEEMCDACGNFGHSENLCPVQNYYGESPNVTKTYNQNFYNRDANMQSSPYYNANRSLRRNRNKVQKTYLFKNNSPIKNLRHCQNSNKFSVKTKQTNRKFRCRKYQNKNWSQNKSNDKDYIQNVNTEIDTLGFNTPRSEMLVPVIEGKINNNAVYILMNTSPSYNVLYKNNLNARLKAEIPIRKQLHILRGFNAEEMVTSEVASLEFSINNHKFREEFVILQSPSPGPYQLMLGLDFFLNNSIMVNFPKEEIRFPDFSAPFVGAKRKSHVTYCDASVQTEQQMENGNTQQNDVNVNNNSKQNSVSQNVEINKTKQKNKTQNNKINKNKDDSGVFKFAGKAVNRLAFRPNTETNIKIKMNATFEKGELIEVKQLNHEKELLIENSIIRVEDKCFWVKVKNISNHVVLVDRGSNLVTIEPAKNVDQNCINPSHNIYSNHVNTESNISPEVTFLEEKKSNLSDYAAHPQFLNIIRKEQNKDRKCNAIKFRLQNGEQVYPLFFHFFVENGILKCKNKNPKSRQQNKCKIVLPRSLMQEVIESCHDAEKENHAGFRQTLFRITETYSWKDMYHHILYYVNNCQNCYEQYYNRIQRREASFGFKERNGQFNNFSPKINQCNKCFKTKAYDNAHNYANHQKKFYVSPKKQNNDKVFNLNDRVYICKHGNPQQTDWCRGEFRISRIISSNVFEIQNERYLWKKLIVQADRLFKCNKQTNNSNFSCNFEPNHRVSYNQNIENHYHDRMVVNSSFTGSPTYRVPKGYNYFPSPMNDE